MSDPTKWKVPKWPFFLFDAILIASGYLFILRAPQAMAHWEVAAGCVGLGALIGIIPFILDYRIMGKIIEVNALGAVAEKIENLEQFTARITAATSQWSVIQESVGVNAEKTAVSAKQIAERMAAEVREFSEFMKKMNDSEKSALRLEADKLRRGETEWLQMLVRIMDHVFVLHYSAMRSDQPKLAEQITQFQSACRGTVRRIGLASFAAEPNEPFDPEKHQLADSKQKPFDGATVAETMACGYTFQGRMLRPALVKLREPNTLPPAAPKSPPKTSVEASAPDDLALEAD